MKLVTCYTNPDIDGTACSYAYSEYLNKIGILAMPAFFGNVDKEARFVIKKFKIKKPLNAEKYLDKIDDIVLVDASEISGISPKIKTEQIVEIIDHRKVNDSAKFPLAKIQIEFVGSAATLIAEKFKKNKIEISKESAALLLSAIISNTINFKAKVTTNRDIRMHRWLLLKIKLPKNYTHEMFADKSKINKPLKKYFLEDKFAIWEFGGTKISTVQMEIIDLDKFIRKNIEKIKKTLTKIKNERSIDTIFLTCIDIEKGFNVFVVIDDLAKDILSKALKIKFNGMIARRNGIIMRKEIIPIIKEVMEK